MLERSGSPEGAALTTKCGRQIAVGRMQLSAPTPIGRVTLRVGPDGSGRGEAWLSLTPTEANDLARALLAQGDVLAFGAVRRRGPR
ncbi:hypothetical protein [Umezawaea sp.]|uniref:hypothetical protein n=1 Tax=Umezawaea sp. TaxID=1955258 RepID=UPI002ED0C194